MFDPLLRRWSAAGRVVPLRRKLRHEPLLPSLSGFSAEIDNVPSLTCYSGETGVESLLVDSEAKQMRWSGESNIDHFRRLLHAGFGRREGLAEKLWGQALRFVTLRVIASSIGLKCRFEIEGRRVCLPFDRMHTGELDIKSMEANCVSEKLRM